MEAEENTGSILNCRGLIKILIKIQLHVIKLKSIYLKKMRQSHTAGLAI